MTTTTLEVVFMCHQCILVYVFCSCRFTFPSLFLVFMLIDILVFGKNSTYTTFIFLHVYFFCGVLCVLSTCSLSCHTRNYPDVVLQFSGFNRQCTQCISLLYPVRYVPMRTSGVKSNLTLQTNPHPLLVTAQHCIAQYHMTSYLAAL